jgi:hypothetical protein
LSAQTHHIDGNPSHNDPANLVCLCAPCHLGKHRYRPQLTPGQLSLNLKLKLKITRPKRVKASSYQMQFIDLIDKLPRLPTDTIVQLELNFK